MSNFRNDFSAVLSDYSDLLTVKDLSDIFKISKKTVYKEIKDGTFGNIIQIGRAYLVPKIHVISKFFSE